MYSYRTSCIVNNVMMIEKAQVLSVVLLLYIIYFKFLIILIKVILFPHPSAPWRNSQISDPEWFD